VTAATLDTETAASTTTSAISGVVYIDGQYVPKATATVPLFDHGYLYGDGVFEGVRVYAGRVFRLKPHLKRLLFSARCLGFRIEGLTEEGIGDAVLETCRRNDHFNGYIRITLSRGTGLGLDPDHIDLKPRLVISTQELRLYGSDLYEQGLTMVTCATRVPSPDVIDPRIKCTGKYINNILAKMEANRLGAGEGLMLNQLGQVAEATGDNLFVVTDGEILTPPVSAGCLKGVTRQAAIDLAADMGKQVREENLTLYDVYTADECFLTGTAAEIIPAVSLDQRPIGKGKPGDITRRLIGAFRAHTASSGTPLG
jgi:branched-chain amino acid aminotransferase